MSGYSRTWAYLHARHRALLRGRCLSSRRPDPQIKSGSATGLTIPRGPRSREAGQWRRAGLFADDAELEKCHREQRFHEKPARLTAQWCGDRVHGREKGGLNFLFAVAALRSTEVSAILTKDGTEIVANTPDQCTAFTKSEISKYASVIKKAGMTSAD